MFRKILICSLFICSLGYSSEGPFNDIAVFRLNNRILFLDDIQKDLTALEALRCFPGSRVMLKAIGLDKKSFERIPSFGPNIDNLRSNDVFLDRLLSLIIAKTYANRFRLSLDRSTLNELFPANQCGLEGGFSSWPENIRALIQAEIYYRNRFVSDLDDEDSLLKEFDKSQVDELKLFIQSLARQFDHGVYYQD